MMTIILIISFAAFVAGVVMAWKARHHFTPSNWAELVGMTLLWLVVAAALVAGGGFFTELFMVVANITVFRWGSHTVQARKRGQRERVAAREQQRENGRAF